MSGSEFARNLPRFAFGASGGAVFGGEDAAPAYAGDAEVMSAYGGIADFSGRLKPPKIGHSNILPLDMKTRSRVLLARR